MKPKIILHIDMDAFFASIEQRDNPKLRGRPVIVGADPRQGQGRGVVSTCSYEARVFGVHSAMPISMAYRKCPGGVYLAVDMKKYQRVSKEIFDILYDFTPDIEPISVDEAFLDISGSYHFYKTPYATALAIKERIKKEMNLIASIGIAPIKMAAKIASDLSKPGGLLEVSQEKLFDFLWPLAVEKLWGVGEKSKQALHAMNIKTIGDLAHTPMDALYNRFGENGRHLFELANGIDEREVSVGEDVKSVSHEHTFEEDTRDVEGLHKTLLYLSEKVSHRLRRYHLKGKTLTVKIRAKGFQTYTRSFTFAQRTNFVDTIYKKSRELFDDFDMTGTKIRLLGVKISNFYDEYVQESLFQDRSSEQKEKIHKAVDKIKGKFGEQAITRGSL
ncbi:MAG: DNA polymerase IV [Candidatus Omnitrophota bacterium]